MRHYRTVRYRLHPNSSAKFRELHALAGACRHVWNHHTSQDIAAKYTTVFVEDLSTKGMTTSAKGKGKAAKAGLNREILKSGWHQLEQMLSDKANVIKVPAACTSQRCHGCGHTEKDNRRTQADFICQACGHRDNAALNVLTFANGATACGGGVDVKRPVKREMDRGVGFVSQSV